MPTGSRVSSLIVVFAALVLFSTSAGCNGVDTDSEYVARVGNQLLTHQELQSSMDLLVVGLDSVDARQQIIEEWITNELLAQEAIRRGLRSDPEVQRLLEENERSVLISALMNDFFSIESIAPTRDDMEAYFAQHRDRLSLREDYIRVRHLSTRSSNQANQARDMLRDATLAGQADSIWASLVQRFAIDPEGATTMASNFYPQSRLFPIQPLHELLDQLETDQIAILEEKGTYHVVQLAARRTAGSTPELDWVLDEIKERLIIEHRKQMIARQVQRLRTEAQARENLEIR